MTGRRVVGAAVLAIAVTASIASVALRLPREFHSPQALYWSKLAAERLEAGDRTNDTRMLFSALGAVDHALRIDGTLTDALFQRGVILERLGFSHHAAKAYAAYLKLDPASVRARVIVARLGNGRARIAALEPTEFWRAKLLPMRAAALAHDHTGVVAIASRFPQEFREYAEAEALGNWAFGIMSHDSEYAERELTVVREIGRALVATSGEALVQDVVTAIDEATRARDRARIQLLAKGHKLYAAQWDSWPHMTGLADLDSAALAFSQARSPMQLAADESRLLIRDSVSRSRSDGCLDIEKKVATTPEIYRAVRARQYMRLAPCLDLSGEHYKLPAAYASAMENYAALHEYDTVGTVHSLLTDILRRSGDRDATWHMRQTILSRCNRSLSWIVDLELISITREALADRSWDVARSAASLSIDTDRLFRVSDQEPRLLRAVAAWNQGDTASARSDLRDARVASTVSEDARTLRQIDATEIALTRRRDGNRADQSLARSLDHALESRTIAQRCDGLLKNVRILRKANKHAEAAAQLGRAMNLLSQSPIAIAAEQLSGTYLGVSTDVYTELVQLLDSRGATADAFTVSEGGRARRLLERMGYLDKGPLSVDAVRRALTPRTLVVSFVTLRDRIVVFEMDQRRSRVVHVPIAKHELDQQIEALAVAIKSEGKWRPLAAALYASLFGSLNSLADYETVVIVPDSVLEHVPFAALIDPIKQRFLIESSSVVIAPSASVYVNLSAMGKTSPQNALIVGDPEFDASKFPTLQRLPAASIEAKKISALYGSTPLLNEIARTTAVLDRMATADVIHIGAHTLIDTDDPMMSSIVVSDGQLRVRDLASRRVRPGSTAILAGCRTATRVGKSDINSLALAFLAAGSRSSVGSLWDVEDTAARRFSVRLHQLLRAGLPVSPAVRQVQLEMLRSSDDPSSSDVRSWAAYQVYGGG
jgi:CHAT domain-containing protein